MTNELEKQFFNTFGIEPKWKSEQCDGWMRTTAVAYFTNLEEAKKFGLVFQEEPEYPQITDTHYLKLICELSKCKAFFNNFYRLQNVDIEQLKEQVLTDCIFQAIFFKDQVRTLFEEG